MIENPEFYARNTDPDTSHEAAEMLDISVFIKRVAQFLYDNDSPNGWTNHEIAQHLDLGECPWHRVGDTRTRGYASWAYDDNGKKIKRPGPTNRRQGATRITSKGRAWVEANFA